MLGWTIGSSVKKRNTPKYFKLLILYFQGYPLNQDSKTINNKTMKIFIHYILSQTLAQTINSPMEKDNSKEEESNLRDWSNTGIDVLDKISQHLGPVEHLKFRCTCRSWRSVGLSCRAPPPKHALLMYPSFSLRFCRRFLNPNNGRRYNFTLHELFADTCIGSCGKWLHMWGIGQYLYNPSTLEKIRVHERVHWLLLSSRLLAISNPRSSTFSIITWYTGSTSFLCKRPGDRKWVSYKFADGYLGPSIMQLIGLKGQFYALTSECRLAHIDLDRDPKLRWMDDIGVIPFDESKEHAYLVESDEALLLVITTCRHREAHSDRLSQCRIYMLDAEEPSWVNAERLIKDKVLFLGNRGSICVPSGPESGPGGRIYTAGKDSFGMFELNGSNGVLCCDHGDLPSAVWVLPELIVRDREPKWWIAVHNVNERLMLRVVLPLGVLIVLAMFVPFGEYFAVFFGFMVVIIMVWFTYEVT